MRQPRFLSDDEESAVVDAIRAAEAQTSAQIRVLVTHQNVADALPAAHEALDQLGMTHTAARNAVLIFVAPESRKFAIAADHAAHEKIGEAVWQGVVSSLKTGFTAGNHGETIARAVSEAGIELARSFPHQRDGKNELPDSVVEQ